MKKKAEKTDPKKLDVSLNQDLSIAVMNLISAEEHLAFTAMKTGKQEYAHVLNSVREMRKRLLAQLIKNKEGEMWCISKHLLAATMRLIEVGTRYIGSDDKKAAEFFDDALDTYGTFWLLHKFRVQAR